MQAIMQNSVHRNTQGEDYRTSHAEQECSKCMQYKLYSKILVENPELKNLILIYIYIFIYKQNTSGKSGKISFGFLHGVLTPAPSK